MSREISLTAELVARVQRIEPDPGPPSGVPHYTDADYLDEAAALLTEHDPRELWIFAYGSLIWKPEVEHIEQAPATAHGWHRSFCLKLTRWRGTPDQPGLMMALDRGGQCRGVAFRLSNDDRIGQLERLLRRETSYKPSTNAPRWIKVSMPDGTRRALAFVANPKGRAYCGRLPVEEVARILARAAGHFGSGAEYLHQTVVHLDAFGIRDRNLWRLQELVAREIKAMADNRQL